MSNPSRSDLTKVVTPEGGCSNHPAWKRLEDQCSWYDEKSVHCQKLYKRLKFCQILLAALIPIFSFTSPEWSKWLTAVSGGAIALMEGLQQLNQYSTLWFTYRATAENLKHEKYLFLSAAGPYKGLSEKEKEISLAERVEEHVSTEHANWFNEAKKGCGKE